MFALVDCNAFYVSCERVFQPHLEGRPVIVLSSNDGCAIARSSEAKAIGIKMGDPLFKIQHLVREHNVEVISSNFSLYGDMSARVMEVLKQFSAHIEIYSIDEAFLRIDAEDPLSYGVYLKTVVKQWTGIPVSVGIAPTKTLAKVANHMAKKDALGCHVLLSLPEREQILKRFPIEDVWGIGSQWSKKLRSFGIASAWDLSQKDHRWLRKAFNIVLARTAVELQGIPCLSLEEVVPAKKSIISSRSFGELVTSYDILKEAVSFHASSIAQKLRRQESTTLCLCTSIRTNPFQKTGTYYSNSSLTSMVIPTNDTALLIKAALAALDRIYKEGLSYKKAGVMALHIQPEGTVPLTLFQSGVDAERRASLFKILDGLNDRLGRGSLVFASEGTRKSWGPKASLKSPSFTQNWRHLPKVR